MVFVLVREPSKPLADEIAKSRPDKTSAKDAKYEAQQKKRSDFNHVVT
jgi:hypothetical protein